LALNEAVPQRLWNSPTTELHGLVPLTGNPSLSSVLET